MQRQMEWIASAVGGRLHGHDVPVTGPVVTDSREATSGALYVARPGANADGHDFLARAVEAGAVAAIVERIIDEVDVPQILVEDATWALGELARVHLADLKAAGDLSVLAVTGSAGKTTTKDLLRHVLSTVGPTVAPKLSFNNEVGLPLTVLRADQDTRFLVLEMGASARGHIDYLTRIAPPDTAIELMVGHAHMGGFGSIDGVAQAKAELVSALTSSGTAVLNVDDPRVSAMATLCRGTIVTFSASGNPDAHVRACDVSVDRQGQISFRMEGQLPDLHADPFSVTVRCFLVGVHHVNNILAAATAAMCQGVNPRAVADALESARADSPHRMDVRELEIEGIRFTLIDDSYNANLDSMRAAFDALTTLAGAKPRMAIVGEMLELGETSEHDHAKVGEMAQACAPTRLIAVGTQAAPVVETCGALAHTHLVDSWQAALDLVLDGLEEDMFVLVKGSNGSGVHMLADALVDKGRSQ